jgi:hypothetical protein
LLRKQRLHILGQPNSTQLPIMEELGIGIAAAALSKFIAAPMSNIVTRKQTAAMLYPNAKAPSTASIYHDIMREKGVSGLWSGYRASLLLTLNPSITFLLYEYCKPHYMKHKGNMGKFDTFILAALCKAAATALTYPMNIVRIRTEMHDSTEEWETMYGHPKYGNEMKVCIDSVTDRYRSSSSSKYRVAVRQANGIVGLLAEIVKKEGISALYIGLAGSVAKGFAHHSRFTPKNRRESKLTKSSCQHPRKRKRPQIHHPTVLVRLGCLQPPHPPQHPSPHPGQSRSQNPRRRPCRRTRRRKGQAKARVSRSQRRRRHRPRCPRRRSRIKPRHRPDQRDRSPRL